MSKQEAEAAEARVRESFGQQGFMQTIGAELTRISSGEVWITMTPTPATAQQHGS